jgi:hypothetical protein
MVLIFVVDVTMWLIVSAKIILGNTLHDTHLVAIAEWVASAIVNDANIGITNASRQPGEGKSDVA